MQIVAVQLDVQWEDKPSNQQKAAELLSTCNIEPGALIVLPEMFDTGFSMNLQATAQSTARESERYLRQLAQQYQAAVIGGVVSPMENGQARNEAVAFAPDGTLLARYHKMQPFTPSGEHDYYGAGDCHCMFEWCGVKISPFVCYDLRFPEVFRPAAQEGTELIVVIASWPAARSEHWVRLLQARAIENLAFTLGVNRCGRDPHFNFDGRSAAFDPHGQVIFEMNAAEQVATCEIDVDMAREWRDKFPALKDMRFQDRVSARPSASQCSD